MAFLDTLDLLGKTLSDKGKEAAKKAKEMTELLQLKAKLSAEESGLQAAYQKAGQLAFESELQADVSEYEDIFSSIRAYKERIAELQSEIEALEGVRVCGVCGGKVARTAAFCSSCGAKMGAAAETGTTIAAPEEAFVEDDIKISESLN